MIVAVNQLSHVPGRGHARSASPGQAFSIPLMPAGVAAAFSTLSISAMQDLLGAQEVPDTALRTGPTAPMETGARNPGPAPASGPAVLATQFTKYIGHSTGSGQCVALVQAASPGLGLTQTWRCGDPVQGNTHLKAGTVIATFDASNRYANATDGSSHAAIYLGQDERGLQVLDQWAGSAAAVRTIPWSNPSGVAANTGGAFHVVQPG